MPVEPALHVRLIAALRRAGVTTVFGLPGGGPNLDVVGEAMNQGMRFVLAHGETAAAIMASTHGALTGTPTAVVATRGPGAASLVNGVAQATLDRAPLVAITDCVPERQTERVAHQRIDQRSMFAPVAKVTATASNLVTDDALDRLLAAATNWPRGAVHLDYDPSAVSPPPAPIPSVHPSDADETSIRQARAMVEHARRPVVVVGVEAVSEAPRLAAVLEAFGCPVLSTYQAIGLPATESDIAAGLYTGGALERPVLDAADLLVTVGLDPVEPIPASWSHPQPVLALTSVAGRDPYVPATLEVVGRLDDLATAVLAPTGHTWPARAGRSFRSAAREKLATSSGPNGFGPSGFGPMELVRTAAGSVPSDVLVTVDAGAHFLAIMPNWPVAAPHRLLISNGLATMGFALPAAIGAAVARPGVPVLALTGDGGLSMVLGELETIGRLALPVTVVVFDDARLSLIEIKQTAAHGGETAVRYRPTDYAALGRSFGIAAHAVDSADGLAAVLSGGWDEPRVIGASIDPAAYARLITLTRG